MELSINIKGRTVDDLLIAMNEVSKKISEGYTVGCDENEYGSYDFDLEGEEKPKVEYLTVHSDSMGVYFWINQVVDSDEGKYKTEEDFGISHNQTFRLEDFQAIMSDHGIYHTNERYHIIREPELIELLVEEFV